ncbi:hypothetical protein [Pelagicoccus sp. SDUM812005]|uniref:hypothetical protein n=1 Tax=Pelagicoccus sp. SDUM812005 TaxID=3041257 RepID=UPI00280CC95F|nr:hypothetical protein [Pelagicoccus sp. SDUM812005]MDQ8179018.1 hypothetical protein [Pelagicoccus sp. SDUM812005]
MNIEERKNESRAAKPSPRFNQELDPDNATSPQSFSEREQEGKEKFYPEKQGEAYPASSSEGKERDEKKPKRPAEKPLDDEEKIDEALEESFPASDPPSTSDPSRR